MAQKARKRGVSKANRGYKRGYKTTFPEKNFNVFNDLSLSFN